MPTAPDPIPEWPVPIPLSTDAANFDARADATWSAADDVVTATNAAAQVTYDNAVEVYNAATAISAAALVAADAAGFVALDTTSTLTVGPGSGGSAKVLHFNAARPKFAVNDQVAIVLRADPSIKMIGTVATFDGSDDMTVSVVSGGVFGTGTYSNWLIISGAFLGSGATAADMWAATTDVAAVTPQSLRVAAAFQTLTETDLVAGWNAAAQGFNAKSTLTANRVVGAPTNLQDGLTYTLNLIQGGSGSYTASWNSIWDFGAGGAPVLSTTVGKIDKVVGQYDATANKIQASFRKAA